MPTIAAHPTTKGEQLNESCLLAWGERCAG